MENVRDIDILGRYGGEEFVILLPETDRAAALYVAERLRENVTATPIETDRAAITLTISLGVATSTPTTENLTPLIDQADGAMYKAKQAGGNCVRAA
jgi:diguanylate cyclase (GGDEF)-like protein